MDSSIIWWANSLFGLTISKISVSLSILIIGSDDSISKALLFNLFLSNLLVRIFKASRESLISWAFGLKSFEFISEYLHLMNDFIIDSKKL